MRPRSNLVGPHVRNSVEESFVGKPSPDSGAPVSPRSSRRESSVAPRPGNGHGVHHEHDENTRQVSARQVCIHEYHERSASCPTLHLKSPTPTPSRNIGILDMHKGNYYNSGSFHEQSVTGAHGSSPPTPKTLQNGIRKKLEDPSMHVNKQRLEVRTSYTNTVVSGWVSSPRSEPKPTVPTTWGVATTAATFRTNLCGPQETRLSNKSLSDLTSPTTETWKQVPKDSSSCALNYHNNNNNNHNYPRAEAMGVSRGGTNDTGHGDSNAMDDYESDRQPSQTPRASMASSTTSSETTNTRISDNGSVTKRRSISAPKREYRCTKKDGCDAVFSCNSLRK